MLLTTVRIERPEGTVVARGVAVQIEQASQDERVELGGAHPIVEVMQTWVVVQRQSLSISERDTIARHAFMRYLAARTTDPRAPGASRRIHLCAGAVVPLTDP